MSVHVNVDNFARAESDRMFHDLARAACGEPLDPRPSTDAARRPDGDPHEPLYLDSFAVVDLAEPAAVTIPDAGERYLSVMIVNQDRYYINTVIHEPGRHELDPSVEGTRYVVVAGQHPRRLLR